MSLISVIIILSSVLQSCLAHGHVPKWRVGNRVYDGWDADKDPLMSPLPKRHSRRSHDGRSYIVNITSPELTCSIGNQFIPQLAADPIEITAGDTIYAMYNTFVEGHPGPVIEYMAKCPGSCSSYKGDTGTPWFKISQQAFSNGGWASERLYQNNNTWPIRIPPQVAPGEYVLRHEIVALHLADKVGGVQIYPFCVPLKVISNGTATPSGIAIPGPLYEPRSPSLWFNPWPSVENNTKYIPPGGPVYKF